jgi:hypothetical protein
LDNNNVAIAKKRKEIKKERKERSGGGLFLRTQMCTGNAYLFLFSGE